MVVFCPYCGKAIDDKADVCLGCGCSVQTIKSKSQNDSKSVGWWWLGFFFPIIGFILWCVWTGSAPTKARRVGWGAIVGTIVSIALIVFVCVIYAALLGVAMFGILYY